MLPIEPRMAAKTHPASPLDRSTPRLHHRCPQPTKLPGRFDLGHQIGVFEILTRTKDEIVFGGLDRHFSVRISMWVRPPDRLTITTVAHHHDRMGHAYLNVVRLPYRSRDAAR